MPGNSFGKFFSITTFGESHGPALGVVIDGVPAGFSINWENVQAALRRRRPGQTSITSPRQEQDDLEVLSGERNGQTIGSPLTVVVRNRDVKSEDYSAMSKLFRPSHADYAYHLKYGIEPQPGGGRASARETVARVIAGAVGQQILNRCFPRLKVVAFVDGVGPLRDERSEKEIVDVLTQNIVDQNSLRALPGEFCEAAVALIQEVQADGDTLGGTIRCFVQEPPVGLGSPVFDKLEAVLAHALMSLPAAKGFEVGAGFLGAKSRGSLLNDQMFSDEGQITFQSNHSGGIQGGISVGSSLEFRVAFKPVSTVFVDQQTVNVQGETVRYKPSTGRHDPCVLPRAVPMVEAMTWIVLCDAWLSHRAEQKVER